MYCYIAFNWILYFFICFFSVSLYAQKDLEEIAQDFIIETKKVTIPAAPHAFNPSIVQWQGRWLMSFRVIENPNRILGFSSAAESDIGLIWLDDDFNPIGQPQFISLNHLNTQRPYLLAED